MSRYIYEIKPKNNTNSLVSFPEKLHQSGLASDYSFLEIPYPVYSFRDEFLEQISEHGLSSLYNFTTALEDITSPSMMINDIEKVIIKFLANLHGAKRLLVIDPYLYATSKDISVPTIFSNFLSAISKELGEVIFITNEKRAEVKVPIHAAVRGIHTQTAITDHCTEEFHDRYWIDPDRDIGVVIGTSLNGLGKKIALVDKLQPNDVQEIIRLAKSLGVTL